MARSEKLSLFLLAFLLILPLVFHLSGLEWGYWGRVLSSALMLSSFSLAQNILLGYTGYPAFGGIAFFGSLPFPSFWVVFGIM